MSWILQLVISKTLYCIFSFGKFYEILLKINLLLVSLPISILFLIAFHVFISASTFMLLYNLNFVIVII